MKNYIFIKTAAILAIAAVPLLSSGNPYKGLLIEPAKKITAVKLVNQDDKETSFPAAEGRYQLVFFGFTHCAMVCPRGLHKIAAVMKSLGNNASGMDFIFVTIDSERDDPERLREYLPRYEEPITGLTGKVADINKLQKEFNIVTRRFQGKTALDYSVEHSAYIYLLDGKGQIMIFYPATATAAEIASDLKLLKQG